MASSASRRGSFGIGLAWAVAGAAVLAASWRMDRLESLHINPWSAPGLMPGLLGALIMLFGLALALRPTAEGEPLAAPGRRTGLALVLCFGFAAGLLGRGFPFWLTSAGFMFAAIFAFRLMDADAGVPRWHVALSSAAIAVGAAAVISFVFEKVFLVRLP